MGDKAGAKEALTAMKAAAPQHAQTFYYAAIFALDGGQIKEATELTLKPKTKKEGSWLQLKSGRWTFITKGCDEEFPNWKQVVPAANSNRTVIRFDSETVATLLAGLPKLPYQDEFHRGSGVFKDDVGHDVAGVAAAINHLFKEVEEILQQHGLVRRVLALVELAEQFKHRLVGIALKLLEAVVQ